MTPLEFHGAHPDNRSARMGWRAAFASTVGTCLEWYDFFLYGSAAALVFGPLFFPDSDPLTGTLQAFATYTVGFIARPLGGIIFGHLGDRVGRRDVLVHTLLLMGIATVGIGLLPTRDQIGVAAPILLVSLRFLQGLGLGGEWAGAVIISIEHGPSGRRGLSGSWPQLGVPVGALLTAAALWALNALMPEQLFLLWGWRIPFLLAGILVLVGLFIRIGVAESPLFAEVESAGTAARRPLFEVLRRHPRGLLVTIGSRIGPDVLYYTCALYVLTYMTRSLGLPRETALQAVVIGSVVQALLIPIAGGLSDRLGRRPVAGFGVIIAIGWSFAFFRLLDTRSPALITVAVVVALACHGVIYGPQAAMIAELFSTRLRYSGASLGYQLAGIAGGALAPIIALKLVERTNSTLAVSIYVAAALCITTIALLCAPETSRIDLRQVSGRDTYTGRVRVADIRPAGGRIPVITSALTRPPTPPPGAATPGTVPGRHRADP
jgi:metabolite-proton symporter